MTFWTKETLVSPLRAICGEKNLTLSFKSCRKCWTLFFVWEQKISEGVFSWLCCSVSANWILPSFSRYDSILRIFSSSNLNFRNIKNSSQGSEIQTNDSWYKMIHFSKIWPVTLFKSNFINFLLKRDLPHCVVKITSILAW